MLVRKLALGVLLSATFFASPSRAVQIDFDNLVSGSFVTNQYPGVAWSFENNFQAAAPLYTGPSPHSSPNVLASWDGIRFNAISDLYVDFSPAVNNLSFLAVATDEFGVVARVNVYSGANLLGTDNIIGTASLPNTFGLGSTQVNLSAYANVTRIEVIPPIGETMPDNQYGGGGIAYDNFSFDQVPEPASAAMLLMFGCGAIGARRGRR